MRSVVRTLFVVLGSTLLLHVCSTAFSNPDDEVGRFVRGDTNDDGRSDISDAVFLLNHLFSGGPAPACPEVGDINDDGAGDISDAVFHLRFLFSSGDPPPTPYPTCGYDPHGATCLKARCNATTP